MTIKKLRSCNLKEALATPESVFANRREFLAGVGLGISGLAVPMAKQHGAPLRLAVPSKYGFKHIKSITRFSFAAERPVSFWEKILSAEYGFWANINPELPHPRWSQATERILRTETRVPTLAYNIDLGALKA